jgi:hypothetical protein
VESILQEKGETWKRFVKAVIPIRTEFPTYSPYIFLTVTAETDVVTGIHFNYFKDTRKEGGKLRHGHGRGGVPVLLVSELLNLIEDLVVSGCLSVAEIDARLKNIVQTEGVK